MPGRVDRRISQAGWRFALAAGLTQTALWCATATIPWVVLQAGLGVSGLARVQVIQFLPSAVLGPWLGSVADRVRPLGLLRAAFLGQAACAALLAVVAGQSQGLSLLPTGIAAALLSGTSLLQFSASQSYLAALVDDDTRPRLTGFMATSASIGRLLGPALSAAALALSGPRAAFGLSAAVCLAAAALLLRLPRLERDPVPARERGVLQGLRYIRSTPAVARPLLQFAVVSLVCLNFVTFTPLIVDTYFRNSPAVLGSVNVAVAIGAIVGGLLRGISRQSPGRTARSGLVLMGTATLVLAVRTSSFAVLLTTMFVIGFGRLLYTSSTQILVVLAADQSRRGVVSGVYGLVFNGTNSPGAALISAAVGLIGLAPALGATAVVALGSAVRPTRLRPGPARQHRSEGGDTTD